MKIIDLAKEMIVGLSKTRESYMKKREAILRGAQSLRKLQDIQPEGARKFISMVVEDWRTEEVRLKIKIAELSIVEDKLSVLSRKFYGRDNFELVDIDDEKFWDSIDKFIAERKK